MIMFSYNDIAIPISWPDQTARGDEKWMAYLKKLGLVKNLNFKVGHAAILLIERKSGEIRYYDFGRYLVPRGYGRARSVEFDPRLEIFTKADINTEGKISNMQEILEELKQREDATHGGGRLLFSVCANISFAKGVAFADKLVAGGPVLYGALAPNNNSCSRFVAQVLTCAMEDEDRRQRKICYPECLKPSPTSNVVNAAKDEAVFCYHQHMLAPLNMGRKASLKFQFGLLKENFSKTHKETLGDDQTDGMVEAPAKAPGVPHKAQWLGGLGEGAWMHIQDNESSFTISKYFPDGRIAYSVQTRCVQQFDVEKPYEFTYNFSFSTYTILQEENLYIFTSINKAEPLADSRHGQIKAIS